MQTTLASLLFSYSLGDQQSAAPIRNLSTDNQWESIIDPRGPARGGEQSTAKGVNQKVRKLKRAGKTPCPVKWSGKQQPCVIPRGFRVEGEDGMWMPVIVSASALPSLWQHQPISITGPFPIWRRKEDICCFQRFHSYTIERYSAK